MNVEVDFIKFQYRFIISIESFSFQLINWFIFSDASNFQAFFNYSEMRVLLDNFSVFHVNAPGQEEGAATLPEK